MLEQSNGSSSTLTKVGGLAEIPTEIWVRRTRHACDEPPSDGFYGIYTLGILDVSDSQWWAHQERVQMPNDAERTFGIAWTTGTSTALARTGLLLKQHNVEFSGGQTCFLTTGRWGPPADLLPRHPGVPRCHRWCCDFSNPSRRTYRLSALLLRLEWKTPATQKRLKLAMLRRLAII